MNARAYARVETEAPAASLSGQSPEGGVPDECLSIVHLLPDILYKLDEEGRFVYLNNSIRLLGYEPEDLLEKHFSVLIHPEDRDGVQRRSLAAGRSSLKGRASASPKLFDERRTGSRITRDLNVRLLPGGRAGTPDKKRAEAASLSVISAGSYEMPADATARRFSGTIGVIRGLADHGRAAGIAPGRLGYYQAMAETSNDVVSVLAGDGTILSCSPSAVRILGHSPDALVGGNIWRYIHEEDADTAARSYRAACGSSPDLAFECRVRSAGGSWLFMKHRGRVMYDSRGRTLCLVMLSIDVTRQKMAEASMSRAFEFMERRVLDRTAELDRVNRKLLGEIEKRARREAELREAEESYRSLVGKIDEVVLELDRNGRIESVNPAILKIAGYEPAEITGSLIGDHLHAGDALNFMSLLERLCAEHVDGTRVTVYESAERDVRMICKNGTAVWLQARCRPSSDPSGSMNGYVVVAADITKRKHAEEDSIRTATIDSLGLFAAGLGHDFNNLLAGILGNLSLVKMRLRRESEEYEHLAVAESAALMAGELARQLLEIPRGGAPDIRRASIEGILRETAHVVLKGSNVFPRFFIRGRIQDVDIDPRQIRQVIHNIVLNAAQAMPGGGEISIAVENGKVCPADGLPLAPGGFVKVSFADTGPGIPADRIKKIFDPYYSTKKRGKGLGLAVSYSIMKKHRGHITVESPEGRGSVFSLYLPVSRRDGARNRRGARRRVGAT